ncbi:hypothetical protein AC15_2397 [Escherichia coli 2-156-04_S3_C2]|nr:hypothetical protein ECSTEC7V_2562 [Escherichia coli STEC_7v]KDA57825.1 hypothetical protein AA98_2436 [Escherichia coli 2-011-08_S1_C1]KDW31502.1 hypothetical protein AC15_2397 [Escherichia coli 2-156-04_S3_C2]
MIPSTLKNSYSLYPGKDIKNGTFSILLFQSIKKSTFLSFI